MNEEEISDLFRILDISNEKLAKYKNPYDFTEKTEKCSILKTGDIVYSSGTGVKVKEVAENLR